MTYQVLARKWRPQDFAGLVGQEPIVTALTNALAEQRVAQAYLFSGIRGVGKTSAARVFAKALNCDHRPGSEARPGADPCNACRPCREITGGADIDVLEIDAATYSKVEQVRELTESLRYGAAKDRYKVVVLDEVHRLSRQAFDALLKIVEEPPPHLVFIFATTEIDAVPATVLSRCQEFQFRRVPSPALAAHLREIADAESIAVSDAALRMIARAGEGSVRDAVALLDQLATFGGGAVRDEDANRLLGGLDADLFRRLLASILAGEHAEVTATVREIEAAGWDPHHVYSQFVGYVRDALHLALGGRPEAVDLPLEEAKALAEIAAGTSYESLLQLAQLLLSGEGAVRRSELALLALEITWLRAAELPKVTRVEDLLSGRAGVSLPDAAEPSVASAPPPAPRKVVGAPPAAGASDRERFMEVLSERKQSLAAHFRRARKLVFEDGALVVHPPPGDSQLDKALARPANLEIFERTLHEVYGAQARYEIRHPEPGEENRPPREPATPAADPRGSAARASVALREKAEKSPAMKTFLATFPEQKIVEIQGKDQES